MAYALPPPQRPPKTKRPKRALAPKQNPTPRAARNPIYQTPAPPRPPLGPGFSASGQRVINLSPSVRRGSATGVKVPPGYVLRYRGDGTAILVHRDDVRRATPGAPGGVGTPGPAGAPAPVDPYAYYRKHAPWGVLGFEQIDRDEKAHDGYVGGTVLPWFTQAMGALTGYQQGAQDKYVADVTGVVGGAYNAAAGATPQAPAPTTPGAIVSGPNAYLTGAGQEYARGMGGVVGAQAANQALLNKQRLGFESQGFVQSLADYAKGLPALYTQRRSDWTDKVTQTMADLQQEAAKAAETLRHHKVTEAISAQNAATSAAIGFGNLGISSDKLTQVDPTIGAPAPYGYTRDVDGSLRRDPSIPTASSSTPSAPAAVSNKPLTPSQRSSMQGSWNRPKNSPPKLGPGWKTPVWDSGTKKWYAKKGPAGATVKPNVGKPAQTVYEKLIKATDAGLISDDQSQGTPDLLRFLKPLQPSKGASWNKWFDDVLTVLGRTDPKYVQWIAGYVKRRRADGTWKGTF
jgi:hypothetical protein